MLSPTRMMMSYFCQHIYSPSHLLSYIHLLPVSLSFFLLADSLSLSSSFPSARSLDLFLIVFTPSYIISALKLELRQKKLNSLLSSLGCTRNTQHQLVFFHHPVFFSVKALRMWLVQANQRIFLHLHRTCALCESKEKQDGDFSFWCVCSGFHRVCVIWLS